MIRRTVIVVALAVAAASCTWPMAGQGPDRRNWAGTEQAITPQNVGRIRNGWQLAASDAQQVVGDAAGVYFRSADRLQALDPATGAERWHAEVAGKSVPGLVGDGVVVAIDGARCGIRRLATNDGTLQATATIGYPYGADATTRSCTSSPSVLTESGRVAVSTRSSATFTVPSCGSPSVHELWSAATTVEVLDDQLRPVWSVTDATIGCGPPPATAPIVPFGDVTRTAAHYVVPKGSTLLAFPQSCGRPCAPAWQRTLSGAVQSAVGLPGARIAVGASGNPPVTVLADADGSVAWTTTSGFGLYLAANDTTLFTVGPDLNAFPIAGCGAPTCAPAWTGLLSAAVPLNGLTLTGHVVIVPRWEQDGFYFDTGGCGAASCPPLRGGAAPAVLTPGAVSVVNRRIYSTMSGGLITFEVAPA